MIATAATTTAQTITNDQLIAQRAERALITNVQRLSAFMARSAAPRYRVWATLNGERYLRTVELVDTDIQATITASAHGFTAATWPEVFEEGLSATFSTVEEALAFIERTAYFTYVPGTF